MTSRPLGGMSRIYYSYRIMAKNSGEPYKEYGVKIPKDAFYKPFSQHQIRPLGNSVQGKRWSETIDIRGYL